ncbi:hypothetical protein DV532_27795 (plasmid) [Pseudomonas sp. Leaf58]|uniref:hypothetical protein n=1 Tax=Pseudomonas sp. Leaf58 TaxID=1736226 RepID=UPI0006F9D966|nr:hypothetical protein [Pseudomonas sp. Leaf58]AYG48085.1 hypothetical protein DV532_27795 [Pseudomonas sp. Leaf58]KQN62361.1 hypothetical protein ASF02_09425 [Pseudomonas sp. Leaf58]
MLMIVLGLVMMIAGTRMIMLKSQGVTSSSTAVMDAVNQRSDRDAINPITHPNARELFEVNPLPSDDLAFAPDCSKRPSLCLLEAVRQVRTPETELAGLPFMSGLQAKLHEVDQA